MGGRKLGRSSVGEVSDPTCGFVWMMRTVVLTARTEQLPGWKRTDGCVMQRAILELGLQPVSSLYFIVFSCQEPSTILSFQYKWVLISLCKAICYLKAFSQHHTGKATLGCARSVTNRFTSSPSPPEYPCYCWHF